MEVLGKDTRGSRNGTCKGPGAATSSLCLRDRNQTNMSGRAKGAWERSEKQAIMGPNLGVVQKQWRRVGMWPGIY